MQRTQLEPFKNRKVIVTGVITAVDHKNKLDMSAPWKRNVRILLKHVSVSGIDVDHIWLYERERYFDRCRALIGEEVKFKAKVVPYVKARNGIYIENYGLERRTSIVSRAVYEHRNEEFEEKYYDYEMDNPFKEVME
ncbi:MULTISPECIES: hypothetical protein [Staphylococcus]|uniref:Single-stranded DNA-binding protein n=1 Tax=Staphylococcus agnetis TaxID=985762 RepID=A0A2T4MGW2_9STAP|nr:MULTISPECIES: hypothetical protein [Staphylococcus]MDG4944308.1 hypothetical protein [Staphylococcus agnetis]NHM75514.1 hypothetical protein [Staphylococcus sp. 11007852]NHM91577.1 hypothetical protein [Staphylococcus sp. 10602379]NJH83497.1 hypothetical protein [Staphylococcus agnetis]NJI01391.1 hypothetical protein [Staphylococcus agnetis]